MTMKKFRSPLPPLAGAFCSSFLLLLFVATFLQAEPRKLHTKLTLIADVQSLQPSSQFTIGVVLTMDKGWHTYWRNPGEAGVASDVKLSLPAGFKALAIQWPIPDRHAEEGDIQTYGYADQVALLIPIEAPATLKAGTQIRIGAHVSWLECSTTCVPGSDSISITLPCSAAPVVAANQELFLRVRSTIPKAFPQDAHLATRIASGNVTLVVTGSAHGHDNVEFYPEELDAATIGRATTRTSGDSLIVTLPLTMNGNPDSAITVHGAIVITESNKTRNAFEVSFPLSVKEQKGLAASSVAPSVLDRQFVTNATDQLPLALYLLLALVGGMLLNIMPCVLPVIALKIFGLVRIAGDEPRKVARHGWSFSFGILVSFLVLALVVIGLRVAGQQVGWGFQFQEPIFVIVMAAIVFVFGLSLFGVFEIRLPAKAAAGVDTVLQHQAERGGYASSFSEGVFATILATPCTAPFLGTALGFAFSQPAWAILLIFTLVAVGMALPYIILTSRPAWMRFLPKPGEWMETAKQFMGFLMMATMLWLLYVLGQQLGLEGVIWTLAFLLLVGVAVWLVGRFATLTASRGHVIAIWLSAAVLSVAAFFIFVSPVLHARALAVETPETTASTVGGIVWERFSTERLDGYLRDGKPVLLDFTADWCLTCKVNERTVLASRDVVDIIRSSGIVTMRADWTNGNSVITALLTKFGRSGVPLYVLFPSGNADAPRVMPEVITTSMMIQAIHEAVTRKDVR